MDEARVRAYRLHLGKELGKEDAAYTVALFSRFQAQSPVLNGLNVASGSGQSGLCEMAKFSTFAAVSAGENAKSAIA